MRIYEQLSIKVLKDPSFNTTLAGHGGETTSKRPTHFLLATAAGPLRCVGHRLGTPGTFQPGRMAGDASFCRDQQLKKFQMVGEIKVDNIIYIIHIFAGENPRHCNSHLVDDR